DGAIIGERSAEPALADEWHAAAGRLALDGFLGLAFRADEEHQAAAACDLGQVTVGAKETANGFTKVDDVDQITLAVDVRPHLRVPAAGPVPEMDAGLDHILNLHNGHALLSCPLGWSGEID